MIVAKNIIDLIGKTPMIRINNLTGSNSAKIYAKLEWYNIGDSVKDRMALYILKNAEKSGRNKKIVAILPDNGYKYLSTNLFD